MKTPLCRCGVSDRAHGAPAHVLTSLGLVRHLLRTENSSFLCDAGVALIGAARRRHGNDHSHKLLEATKAFHVVFKQCHD